MRIAQFYRWALILAVAGCAGALALPQSQEKLWQQFGHKSVDGVLMSWGTPTGETRLTNGSRLVTYRRSTVYDAGSPYEQGVGCEVTFLAKAPRYTIENIAMKGSDYECSLLAAGRLGSAVYPYIPPPAPFYPYHPFYR